MPKTTVFSLFFFLFSFSSLANNIAIDSLQQIIDTIQSEREKAKLYFQLSKSYYSGQACLNTAKEGLKLAKKFEDNNLLGMAYNAISWGNYAVNLDKEAVAYADSALLVFNERDYIGLSRAFRMKGIILKDGGFYELAIEACEKAYNYAVLSKDLLTQSSVLNNWGILLTSSGQYQLAIEKHLASLAINKQLKLKLNIGRSYFNIGKVHQHKGDLETAFSYFLKSYQLSEEVKSMNRMVETISQIAVIFFEIKAQKLPIENYRAGLKRIGFTNPFDMLDTALNWPRMTEFPGLIKKILNSKIKGYEVEKDYKAAFQTLQRRIILVDNQNKSEENLKALADLKTSFENEKLKNDLLQAEIEEEKQVRQQNYLLSLLAFTFILLLSGGIIYRQKTKRHELQVKFQNQAIKKLQQERKLLAYNAMLDGQEQERKRIAMDLHDGLGNLLSSVKRQFSNYLQNDLYDNPAFQNANQLLDEACSEVRKIAHEMMPQSLKRLGLSKALFDLSAQLQQTNNIEVDIQSFGMEQRLPDSIEINLYRITQELFNNIRKHANASKVFLQLVFSDNWLDLIVEDNGRSFDKNIAAKGLGLESIKTRVASINGAVNFDTQIGQGTCVNISVPIKEI